MLVELTANVAMTSVYCKLIASVCLRPRNALGRGVTAFFIGWRVCPIHKTFIKTSYTLVLESNLKSPTQILEPSSKIVTRSVARQHSASAIEVHTHADDPRWLLALRIAASGSLGRSRLLSEFLLYVVDRYIRDRTAEITEQQIGVLVFGRNEGYDSNDDNIVRSYARNLRKRIDEYFATEGREEPLRLEIPRGGYAPAFFSWPVATEPSPDNLSASERASSTESDDSGASPSLESDATATPLAHPPEESGSLATGQWNAVGRAALRNRGILLALCIGMALGVGCTILRPLHLLKRMFSSSAEAATTNLWSQLFVSDRDTFIVPSDDGLIIMQRLIERPVPLASYVNGSYRTNLKIEGDPSAPEILKLGGRRFTSMVDLAFVSHLAQLNEVVPSRMKVVYARDLRIDDLRTGNAVLIGSTEANPWIELFQPHMNFQFSINIGSEKPSGLLNLHPRVGENALYGTLDRDRTYGLIAYKPNLTSTGHVLVVGGLNTAGTEAATTFLLTPSLMMPTLKRARTVHGDLQPFELLIGAGNVATNASAPQLIVERIGPTS